MATIRFILGIICLVGTVGYRLPHRHLLGAENQIIRVATSQLGVKEIGGNNRGPMVKNYLAYVNLKEGYPWCAAFVSWVYGACGYATPKTAWSPALFPTAKRTNQALPAALYGLYSVELKRIYHCGITERLQNDWVIGIEGNTNVNGSNDGDGVYRKWRHRRTIALFANWLPQKGGRHE